MAENLLKHRPREVQKPMRWRQTIAQGLPAASMGVPPPEHPAGAAGTRSPASKEPIIHGQWPVSKTAPASHQGKADQRRGTRVVPGPDAEGLSGMASFAARPARLRAPRTAARHEHHPLPQRPRVIGLLQRMPNCHLK